VQPPRTTSSTTSGSDPALRLYPGVLRWIHGKGWTGLRPAQAEAVEPVLAGDQDVIISAPTAGGKTEAAFFPICSRLAQERDGATVRGGIEVLYASPLKALINDQCDRLELLCADLDIPVHRWHGDVPASAKARIRRSPAGVVIITPESVEALFVTAGADVARILGGLRYVIVDELHAFLGTERGMQLQSLMHRAETAIGRRVPRIALSATLADPTAAKDFLRPGEAGRVRYICPDGPTAIRLRVYGHRRRSPDTTAPDEESSDVVAISEQIFRGTRGSDHLVFANSRGAVETFTDGLARLAEQHRVPNEFFAHHGNLSKEEREHVEARLKGQMPTTAVCTSTLEMGVDIGSVDSVIQIGPPPGVAALRQRLGRSGRRGGRSVLMVHISEPELDAQTTLLDELRPRLVQTIAMIELMGEGYLERPDPAHPHLSTLVQQVLSVIAQQGGASASALHALLCRHGPFRSVRPPMFADLLRAMGAADLLIQGTDGFLLAGSRGDRMINHYSFYTAFHTPEEFRLVHGSRTLGTLPVDHPIQINSLLLFAGRRWRVTDVNPDQRLIQVVPASGGRPEFAGGGGPPVADEVRRRMRDLYLSTRVPPWLDHEAVRLLDEGRAAFARYELDHIAIVERGRETLILPWRGDKIMNTLAVLLQSAEVPVEQDGVALTVPGCSPTQLRALFTDLAARPEPDPNELAAKVPVKQLDKHDHLLGEPLLASSYAARLLDVAESWAALRLLSAGSSHVAPDSAAALGTPGAAPGDSEIRTRRFGTSLEQ
jgi:ATP-dependent Lhr-like helicase